MELSGEFPVKLLCETMGIQRSSFYNWKKRLSNPSSHTKIETLYIELVEGKNYLVPDSVFTVVVKGQFALLQDRPAIGNALRQSIHDSKFREKMLKIKWSF